MKIAIHTRPNSYSERWIQYCITHDIQFKIVNCYSSNIIHDLADCDGLMWHWRHDDYRDMNFAKGLITALEKKTFPIFPNINTCSHFDDKVAQKYLLESINAPIIPSHVFYDKTEAINFSNKATYPIIWKLKGGAGSQNVKLISNKAKAYKIINKSFKQGYPSINKISNIHDRLWRVKRDKSLTSIINLGKGIFKSFLYDKTQLLPRHKGYVYFQDYIPGNKYDDRIIVFKSKAIAIRRFNRVNDFKASGSGLIEHSPSLFNPEALKIAFETAKKLNAQVVAFDFLYGENKPLITEISYAFSMGSAYDDCPGYWNENLKFIKDNVDPQRYIIEDFINVIREENENSVFYR